MHEQRAGALPLTRGGTPATIGRLAARTRPSGASPSAPPIRALGRRPSCRHRDAPDPHLRLTPRASLVRALGLRAVCRSSGRRRPGLAAPRRPLPPRPGATTGHARCPTTTGWRPTSGSGSAPSPATRPTRRHSTGTRAAAGSTRRANADHQTVRLSRCGVPGSARCTGCRTGIHPPNGGLASCASRLSWSHGADHLPCNVSSRTVTDVVSADGAHASVSTPTPTGQPADRVHEEARRCVPLGRHHGADRGPIWPRQTSPVPVTSSASPASRATPIRLTRPGMRLGRPFGCH
jgi:hypothetical protein